MKDATNHVSGMKQLEKAGPRWPRKARDILGRALLIGMIIAAYSWVNQRMMAPSSSETKEFSMRVTQELGPKSKASRCAGDCAQMEDTYTATVWGGSTEHRTSIYAYIEGYQTDRLVTACDGCESLAFVLHSVGKYHIVGLSKPRQCSIDQKSLDRLISSARFCGGSVEHSSFEVR